MVKVILQLYPMIPAKDEAERAARRPIARNSEIYQEVLTGWHDVVKAADEMGMWGIATIEHHFHSEGYEVGPNPGVLNGYWAAITKNIRIGQMGYVMSAQNPIRVAEETAILDHLTRGRFFVGFARGYQSRWVNVLSQHLGSRATRSPSTATKADIAVMEASRRNTQIAEDKANRDVFEQQLDMVLRAWTEESIEAKDGPWQIPYPYENGIDDWPLALEGVTERLGAHGEVDANRVVRRISVVPAPYTKPHPPVFVMSLGSPESIAYCGRKGFVPVYVAGLRTAVRGGQAFADAAKATGRSYAWGQNQGVLRYARFGKTMADARRAVLEYDAEITRNFYAPFWPPSLARSNDPVDNVLGAHTYFIGTPEDVREQFVAQWKVLPAEYVVLIWHYAQQPKQATIDDMEQFMKHVKPALDEMTRYNE
jgi:alkanesulfonate monooxygenase SsuD/methylene tetrahydromethanopterin reductase-like flavin-dependent oxidoreductase (luciferase family)